MTSRFIYLVEAENGLVKIGLGQIVRDRVTACRTHSPVRVRLIAMWPGSDADDDALKERFRAQRHHCEWFVCSGEFADFVEQKRGLGVDDVPAWSDLLFANNSAFTKRRHDAVRWPARPKAARQSTGAPGGLTKQQRRALNFIRREVSQHGVSPSYQEIGSHLGLASKSGVHRLVHALVERGHLEIAPNLARSVVLASPKTAAASTGAAA